LYLFFFYPEKPSSRCSPIYLHLFTAQSCPWPIGRLCIYYVYGWDSSLHHTGTRQQQTRAVSLNGSVTDQPWRPYKQKHGDGTARFTHFALFSSHCEVKLHFIIQQQPYTTRMLFGRDPFWNAIMDQYRFHFK